MNSETTLNTVRFNRRHFLTMTAGAAVVVSAAGRLLPESVAAANLATGSAFLDPGSVHTISATFDQTKYDAMIQTYSETGDKEWIEAKVAIDGSTYEKVGMRLKGNSSLMGLRNNSVATQTQGQTDPAADGAANAGQGQMMRVNGGPGGNVSADIPESLPWLIRLDKYVDDQNHHGMKELVIRSNNSSTSLNEAVALDLLAKAGLASQLAAPTAFSVNASEAVLRLAIEHPNDEWMAAHFSVDGLLFKSESTGDWTYRGAEAASYNDIFDLEAGDTGDDGADFEPLTSFLDFINNSDDSSFATDLPARLDVDGFAAYLTMMDLVDNFDDIDGPGNNSYLYVDRKTTRFTVVPWDMNLAFGGMMGGGGPGKGFDPSTMMPPGDNAVVVSEDGTPVAGPDIPTDAAIRGNGGMGGPAMKANPLVDRFRANTSFSALLDEKAASLRASLYDSGVAAGILAGRVEVLSNGASTLVDQATITTESDSIAAFFSKSK